MCYCCNEEGNSNLLPLPSFLVVLQRRRQLVNIAFFFVFEKKKKTAMQLPLLSSWKGVVEKKKAMAADVAFFLGRCYRKEKGDDNNYCYCLLLEGCCKEEEGDDNYHCLLLRGVL
jgi:hypothetical protein